MKKARHSGKTFQRSESSSLAKPEILSKEQLLEILVENKAEIFAGDLVGIPSMEGTFVKPKVLTASSLYPLSYEAASDMVVTGGRAIVIMDTGAEHPDGDDPRIALSAQYSWVGRRVIIDKCSGSWVKVNLEIEGELGELIVSSRTKELSISCLRVISPMRLKTHERALALEWSRSELEKVEVPQVSHLVWRKRAIDPIPTLITVLPSAAQFFNCCCNDANQVFIEFSKQGIFLSDVILKQESPEGPTEIEVGIPSRYLSLWSTRDIANTSKWEGNEVMSPRTSGGRANMCVWALSSIPCGARISAQSFERISRYMTRKLYRWHSRESSEDIEDLGKSLVF